MKFGAQLKLYAYQEWLAAYVDYKGLKSLLKEQKRQLNHFAKWTTDTGSNVESFDGQFEAQKGGTTGSKDFLKRRSDDDTLRISTTPRSSRRPSFLFPQSRVLLSRFEEQCRDKKTDFLNYVRSRDDDEDGCDHVSTFADALREEALQTFNTTVDAEVDKVVKHYKTEERLLGLRMSHIDEELHSVRVHESGSRPLASPREHSTDSNFPFVSATFGSSFFDDNPNTFTSKELLASVALQKKLTLHRKELQRCVMVLWDIVYKLEEFIKLNTMSIYKILKKRDKILSAKHGAILHDLSKYKNMLNSLLVDSTVKVRLKQLYRECCESQSSGGVPQHSPDAQYDPLSDIEHTLNSIALQQGRYYRRLPANTVSFFGGLSLGLLLTLATLMVVPARNPNYDIEFILLFLPVFRLVFAFISMWMSVSAAILIFEHYGVNYRFLFDMDTKYAVNSALLFALSLVMMFLWICCFALFLVDYKFLPFGRHNWYIAYPGALLVSICCLWLYPNKSFRYRYKRAVLKSVATTLSVSIFVPQDVTLASNVVGDMITSMSKPMADIGFCLCFIYNSTAPQVLPNLELWLHPILLGLPFWIRLVQCYARFRDEPDKKSGGKGFIHIANFSKYLSSLLVVAFTGIAWHPTSVGGLLENRLMLIALYMISTAFSFVWDVYMDWGLVPDADSFVRPYQQSLYPTWLYYAIPFLNLVGRLTWALTLMSNILPGGVSHHWSFGGTEEQQ
eukprot:Lankesteria_metandrocarpae@DN4568_c0_g1_i4.p1